MTETEIKAFAEKQRTFFNTGKTLSVKFRRDALIRLHTAVSANEDKIADALSRDLGKSRTESYMCEIGMVLSELSHMIRHMAAYAADKTVPTPLAQFASRSFVRRSPYGVTLIMSPWNYPFLLSMEPLCDAIAAGNTVVLKPSAYAPATAAIIRDIAGAVFDEEYVAVVTGGRAENQALLSEHFDLIFFTGSQNVGREVLHKAAEHLTPAVLELGGKSPCIVDRDADLKLAAKRIAFGKFLNLGQTCVAPDHIYVHSAVKEEFLKELKHQIVKQYGRTPINNKNYGKIINEKHFNRLLRLLDTEKVIHGGKWDAATLKIEPTVMDHVSEEDPVMQEEIFGPILPILDFDSTESLIRSLQQKPHPLALYYFSNDKSKADRIMSLVGFGGGCINDVVIHLASSELPFGGFGESGMGAYHGKYGFDAFSHNKGIVDKKTWIDLPMRYQPYRKIYDRLIHIFMK